MTVTDIAKRVGTVRDLLTKMMPQIQQALPEHMKAERMVRVVMTTIQKNPKLADCDQRSLLGAILESSQLGLEPDGVLGMAYLVPFNNRKAGILQCQLIVGYKGLIDLSRRSGNISTIDAHEVRKKDHFKFAFGLKPVLEHTPFPASAEQRGEVTHFYAVCQLRDGGVQFAVMHKTEVDAIRARSRSSDSGPWVTDYEAMGKKTVLRQLAKLLPVSVETQRAIALDEEDDTSRPVTVTPLDLAGTLDVLEPPEPMRIPEPEDLSMSRDLDEMADRIAKGLPQDEPKRKPRAKKSAEPTFENDPQPGIVLPSAPVPAAEPELIDPQADRQAQYQLYQDHLNELETAPSLESLYKARQAVTESANGGKLSGDYMQKLRTVYAAREAELEKAAGKSGDLF